MSGPSKELDEIGAGSSGMLASSEMEGEDEYYNPDGTEWSQKAGLLCRICANPNEYLIPIFDGEGLEHELGTKIQKHLPIKVTETDTLPIHVCYQCASTLIAWHDLVNCCVEADKKLRELQMVEDDEDDDDKGAEMFESHSFDSEMVAEDDGPSTSELQNQAPEIKSPKKLTVDKKSKLKMVLVKGSAAGTSGQKIVPKIQVAKVELGKPKEGTSQDSASERCSNYAKEQIVVLSSPEEESSSIMEERMEDVEINESYDDLCAFEVFGLLEHRLNDEDQSGPKIIDVRSVGDYVGDHDYFLRDNYLEEFLRWRDKEKMKSVKPPPVQCQHCDTTCVSHAALKRHIKDEHKDLRKFVCKVCKETFTFKRNLLTHSVTHFGVECINGDEGIHLCHACGKTFSTSATLRSHERAVHASRPISAVQEYICEICGLTFNRYQYLKKHSLIHGEKNFVCETCGKRFVTNHSLKLHQESHSEHRPYACKVCGTASKSYRNLLAHEKEVHGIFPVGPGKEKESLSFSCQVCKKEFTTPKRVSDHMRVHTGERPFECGCGRKFRVYPSLMFHRRVVHEGRKLYGTKGIFPCNICHKVFSSKHYRDQHVVIHTGERPHVCKICGRAFALITGLVQHSSVHSDIKPHICKLCGKTFRRRETLIIHLRTHTGEKPYVCDICNRGFSQSNDMKKHKLKIHNVLHQRKVEKIEQFD